MEGEPEPEPLYICALRDQCKLNKIKLCPHSIPHTFVPGACDFECTNIDGISAPGGVCLEVNDPTTNDYVFYSRLVSLTTNIHQELEALSALRYKIQDEGQEIQSIETIGPMLGDLQMLGASIDVIAKLTAKHTKLSQTTQRFPYKPKEPQEDVKYPCSTEYNGD